jgi:hypothetical protein
MSSAIDAVHAALGTRRGELAKLSDAELAERLQEASARYENADQERRSRSLFWRKRKTADLPVAYRMWAWFHASRGFRAIEYGLWFVVHSYTGIEPSKPVLVSEAAIKTDDQIDEIEALAAEIKRRVERCKAHGMRP